MSLTLSKVVKRRKISTPFELINLDVSPMLTPDITSINDLIISNDDIEDSSSIINENVIGKTQCKASERANKDSPANEISEFSNIFKSDQGNQQMDSGTSLLEDPKAKPIDFNPKVVAQNKPLEVYKTPAKPKSKVSDIWNFFEETAVTSTTNNSAIATPSSKTLKFSHNPRTSVLKLRQSTLGVPSTKSTLKKRKGVPKRKKKVQSGIKFAENEKKTALDKTLAKLPAAEAEIQVPKSDSIQPSSQQYEKLEGITELDTLETSPTVKYKKRVIEKRITRSKVLEPHYDPGEIIKSSPVLSQNNPIGANQVLPNELLSTTSNKTSELKKVTESFKESNTKKQGKPARKTYSKRQTKAKKLNSSHNEATTKRITRSSKSHELRETTVNPPLSEGKNNCEEKSEPEKSLRGPLHVSKEATDKGVLIPHSELSVIPLIDGEDQFQHEVREGLNLFSRSLINRMKLVELEISRKENKLREDLEARFKEVTEFQQALKANFGTYVNNLMLQMVESEKELQNWINRNR